MELHIAQVQDGCDCAPDSLHLIRLEAKCFEGITGALVVRLLGEDVHATLVQIVILGHLLVQIILTQLVVAGAAQQLQEEEKDSISSCSTHDNTLQPIRECLFVLLTNRLHSHNIYIYLHSEPLFLLLWSHGTQTKPTSFTFGLSMSMSKLSSRRFSTADN